MVLRQYKRCFPVITLFFSKIIVMIRSGLTIILLCLGLAVFAQQDPVLMRINGKEILRSEFEYIYNKNNALAGIEQKTLSEYVDLFVNFKLKVAAAEAAGLDTTRAFREELEGYRRQLAKAYLTDEAVSELAARQVYDKMKANNRAGQIRVSHIFKSLPQTVTSHVLRSAEARMDSLYAALQNGQADFDECVRNFSDEKKSFWVSWLQMPVEFEDVVFALKQGEISRPFFTPQGIHIVKAIERKEILPFEKVKDEIQEGNPLVGATVVVKGANNKNAVADMSGEFVLQNLEKNAVLQISYIGFQTQEVKVGAENSVRVVLKEDEAVLGEVVVVGYGTQKKQTLTGAISTLSGDKVLTTKSTSVAQSLQGKIAGVQIRQQDGQPGSFSSMVQIRGFGSPLYVIDGVVRDSGDGGSEFQRLNPEDIENISVLKDGAAAIYGMNAANGVVIITTKKGRKGKARFNYNGSFTAIFPTSMMKVMNAAQYAEISNELSMNAGTGPTTTPEELAKWQAGGPGYESTDWLDAVFKKSAGSQQHTLSVEGGSDKMTYYASFGYAHDGDLTRGGDFNYERYTMRSNFTAQLSKYLKAEVNVSGRYDVTNAPIQGVFDLLFKSTLMRPTSGVYANNNSEYYNAAYPFLDNPVAAMNGDLTGMNTSRGRSLQSTATLTYDVPWVKGLKAKLMTSYDASDNRTSHERKLYQLYSYNSQNESYDVSKTINDPSSLYVNMNNGNNLNIQAQLSYSTTIARDHNISLMAMYEMNHGWNDNVSATREYEIYSKPILDLGSQTNIQNSGGYGETANISYLGRLNYDYQGKYLLEGAFRYNGSYRYAPGSRWGFFPVVSAGWRMSEESFIKDNISFVSNLKLRASYGETGIDAGNEFQFIEGFTMGSKGYEFVDGTQTNGVLTPALINKNLTWITTRTYDLGVDITLWDGLLDFTFDVYRRDRDGLLATRGSQLTNTFGASLPEENLNADRTEGIEFTLGHRNKIGQVSYGVQGNFNFARSKMTRQIHGQYESSWDVWKSATEGRWSGIGWGYTTAGQFQNYDQIYNAPVQSGDRGNTMILPGDYYLQDVNGDGYIDGNDMKPKYYGLNMPALNYGVTLTAEWKWFDFMALFQGAACYSIQIPDNLRNYAPWEGNSSAYLYDRWHREDPFDANSNWIPGRFPAARVANYNPMGNNAQETDRNTVDGSYLRLKSLEVGYTLPQRWASHVGLQNLRVYVNAYNIFTFCDSYLKKDLKLDPEKTAGQDNRMMNYPLSSSINFGVNVSF